ncbi:interferon gamma receptor 1-like isoform X2 [Scyliorhinus torazame]|uniref:interferon gamma receptor 1-like isoform X2 n=1 Tax=Scyliorhinus torazame TaxID=75743 RepID=UPI003B594F9E
MWRSGVPVSSLLFFLCCWDKRAFQALGHPELHPPENLSITSSDFHTVLTWDVVATSRASRFNVEFLEYRSGKWKPFEPCSNISMHQCDLSEAFIPVKNGNGYCARVNAVTSSQKSNCSHTYRFTFGNNATLGPPTVHLTADENKLIVELNYTVPHSTTNKTKRILKYLSYNIYYWNPETPEAITEFCREKYPYKKITVPVGVTCVSAEVRIDILKLKGKRSQKRCLPIQSSNQAALAVAISGGICAIIGVGLIATLLVCYFVKKKQAVPKFLVHRFMGGKPYTNVNMQTEESNISVVTASEKVSNICEVDQSDQTPVEMMKDSSDIVVADPVTVDPDDSKPVNADLNDSYAPKIDVSETEQKSVGENNIEESSDLEKTHDLCKIDSDIVKQICADNWGYDKPQVPLVL